MFVLLSVVGGQNWAKFRVHFCKLICDVPWRAAIQNKWVFSFQELVLFRSRWGPINFIARTPATFSWRPDLHFWREETKKEDDESGAGSRRDWSTEHKLLMCTGLRKRQTDKQRASMETWASLPDWSVLSHCYLGRWSYSCEIMNSGNTCSSSHPKRFISS